MLVRRKSACKTSAGSSKILRWLTPLLGPNLDPKTGPKQRLKRRNENVIQFWTPFWGPYLDPKMGSAIGEFRSVTPLAQGCIGSNPVGLANLILTRGCKHPSWVLCVELISRDPV